MSYDKISLPLFKNKIKHVELTRPEGEFKEFEPSLNLRRGSNMVGST